MNTALKILAAATCNLLLGLSGAQAAGTSPVYLFMSLGDTADALTVFPRELRLKAGTVYKFVVSNPSKSNHVVTARELSATAKTVELFTSSPKKDYQTADLAAGITMQPGQMLEWTFIPQEAGKYKVGCSQARHAAAGMQSIIEVVPMPYYYGLLSVGALPIPRTRSGR